MRLAFRQQNNMAYLCVKEVQDPSQYGVVEVDISDNRVTKYVDRPTEFVSNQINTGVYLFNNSILDKIQFRSLELDILPRLADEGSLYYVTVDGYWMDIGLPHNYLKGTQLYLSYLAEKNNFFDADLVQKHEQEEEGKESTSSCLATGNQIIGNVMIHPTATVDKSAVIGPNVVIGEKCRIGSGCRISNTTILP